MLRGFCLAIATLVFAPNLAEAKFFLITYGDTITRVGDIAKETNPNAPAGLAVGYKYTSFGLFWLNFWTWSGEYCLYQGKDWQPIDEATAAKAMGIPTEQLSKPFWYRYPAVPFLLMVIGVLIIPIAIFGSWIEKREKKIYEEIKQDPEYKIAHELATTVEPEDVVDDEDIETPAGMASAGKRAYDLNKKLFDSGVAHLVKSGVVESTARRNLRVMIEVKAKLKNEKAEKKTAEDDA